MTSIEQIQISGVRSFDPNPAHRQTIVFQKPLTVILGKNGAGKTTIIEALLNACTGQMPPGSGSEKSSFVYDPKVMGETDVKAQIRLLFTGRGGKVMQVIRSFQALRTRTKTTFTTLDSTVAFQDTATGKVLSSTYRANDVDRAVPEMLGVSPAVLEHVIFCHQEDANWPLLPPKEVKKYLMRFLRRLAMSWPSIDFGRTAKSSADSKRSMRRI
ncbi:putative DNA repair protein RAD50 [Trypanosoma cruzi]|nr:putative DNA repair protein RAD50 [Trypanosoma cruzi]